MARRGRASAPPPRTVRPAAPARAPAPAAHPPAPAPASTPMVAAPSQGPSLMGQMAATAGGVAIGSAVGHTIGHAMTGMGDLVIIQPVPRQPGVLGTFAGTAAGVAVGTVIGDKITGRSESDSMPALPALPAGPCQFEEQQLLGCAQTQEDLQVCTAFKQAWLECKQKFST
ncbi:hypothetical protein QAD02_015296 [Eretmocerus hayati]|uniref:Uncharacterized protein n=1 Tax=Eretmocerus hayati TaxID=131215 RepID=A0ACC2P7G0_9HYME|nr:hypothetical protein QAD02_015296 [Eretmocerus hayati]